MAREEHFPVDLEGSQLIGGHPLRWTATTIAVASLFLLATNAITLDGWAAELEPTPWTVPLVDATARWRAATDAVGAGVPRAALHADWKRAQAARMPGQAAAE